MRSLSQLLQAAFFIYVGFLHFLKPAPFVAIVPAFLPAHEMLVYISGVAEIAGGIGILVAPVRRAAAWGLLALLVAVFPANINMAINRIPLDGKVFPDWQLWLRLPLQFVLMYWIYW